MNDFKLDARLKNDCIVLSESEQFIVLLMNNSLVPWFILVPKTDKTELYELDDVTQLHLSNTLRQLSIFVNKSFQPDKMNVAAIGNIVSQMHIHVIGRYSSDPYWPGVVWGAAETKAYKTEQIESIKESFNNAFSLQY
ncbi:MAG: HIT family protein [Gammaproteobacteria bacterium]|nr:HIT family protein [Gammaproteobacteria bacterium]